MRSPRHAFDARELEILETAFEAAWAAIKATDPLRDRNKDANLKAVLRRKLIGVALAFGVSDAATLRNAVLATMPPADPAPSEGHRRPVEK